MTPRTSPEVITEGVAAFRGYRTWYRITGRLDGRAPLVVLHGGPGGTHDYLLVYAQLTARGQPVVHYDQLGNGRSTHLADAPPGFWMVELFLAELDNLLRRLDIDGAYHLLGHSWGGMLAAEHASRRPAGLRSLVLSSTPASIDLYTAETNRLRAKLPPAVERVLRECEAAGTTDSPEYAEAVQVFYRRHVCRLDPWPRELVRSFQAVENDPTVYLTMNGPSEFHVIGTIAGWSLMDQLPTIQVPTLVLSTRYDEVGPAAVNPLFTRIPDVTAIRFESSSHVPHLEESERCLSVVAEFLDQEETA
jgi:L-proline amide hydrolase